LRINGSDVSVSDEGGFESGGIKALFEDREGNLWLEVDAAWSGFGTATFVTYTLAAGSPPSNWAGQSMSTARIARGSLRPEVVCTS